MSEQIWIVDFGSQYTQLITRKTRELNYSSIILHLDESIERIKRGERPSALILSGGPRSVFKDDTDFSIFFNLNIPILGICYGMQIIGQFFGGKVEKGVQGEYGHTIIHGVGPHQLPENKTELKTWMSHFDHVSQVPDGFEMILESDNGLIAGMQSLEKSILALQFHPEVHHTDNGKEILNYFFSTIAKLKPNWSNQTMLQECMAMVEQVKGKKVLCAFSGGVDSLVAGTLASKVLGSDLYCFFINNGLLRPQDHHHIEKLKKELDLQIEIVDASQTFLGNLKGESDPEKKRKIIGNTFIDIFEQKIHEFEANHGIKFEYLLQGTLYPDVIESVSPHGEKGNSVTIKSHHNVGGLPDKMHLQLLEPLKYLFKDEVRELGKELGLNPLWVHRHPFPGPGVGVRILGEVDEKSVRKVQESDQILFEELHNFDQYDKCWQAFTVLLPVETVGVKGDARAYEQVICVRIVDSVDGMTATWSDMPRDFLSKVSSRITNEVAGITRTVYDITSKPPGTIEWE